MSLGINDTFPFGKYKGVKVHDVLLKDAGYCAWLREEKKKAMQPLAFDIAANSIIDEAIKADSALRRKYTAWNMVGGSIEDVIKSQVAAIADAETADQRRDVAYAGTWGEW